MMNEFTGFNASLCYKGVLGGMLLISSDEMLFCTNKILVSSDFKRLHMKFTNIDSVKLQGKIIKFMNVHMHNGREYRFLIFSPKRIMTLVNKYMEEKNI